MLTSLQCQKKYGDPKLEKWMVRWNIPNDIQPTNFPDVIYCNKDLIAPLSKALKLIKDQNLDKFIFSFNGCFNIRAKKGNSSYSLHSWGVAIDINAATNAYKAIPKLDMRVVKCFEEAGFDWGGYWKIPDGMHFQLKKI